MTNHKEIHFFHYMALSLSSSGRGWVSPAEMPKNDQSFGTLVAPVDDYHNLFDRYIIKYVTHKTVGQFTVDETLFDLQPNGWLKGTIGPYSLKFRPLRRNESVIAFKYVGNFSHPDLNRTLVEMEAESDEYLDRMFDDRRIIIAGCDPVKDYS